MGCNSCSSGKGGLPPGCKNNGVCGTDGCNKLTVFDWLSNMSMPSDADFFNAAEVRYKNGRKEYYQNSENLSLQIGDVVVTEAATGYDVGVVTLTGELVRLQLKKRKINTPVEGLPKIYRKASQREIDVWQGLREKENGIQKHSREIAMALGLEMKISDVEYQGDGSKIIFYYTANDRVDFRELIKEFAHTFHARIEMKQIGFRQEAARLGGIGSCGRELCCSTWLTDFRSVNTSAARYQQLSLNPQKLAGQCGKLKCCLNYELDTYLEALKTFPDTDVKLLTRKGVVSCQKIDIFKDRLWYAYENDSATWHEVTSDAANEIIKMNAAGQKPESIEKYAIVKEPETLLDIATQDSVTRFDKTNVKKRKKKSRRKKGEAPVQTQSKDPKKDTKNKPRRKKYRKPKKND